MRRAPGKRFPGYSAATLGAAVAALSFVATLQLSATTPQNAEPMLIDRTLKGDRLQMVPGAAGAGVERPNPALPQGCLAQADGARTRFATEVPGRCLV